MREAAEALRLTAQDLLSLGVVDRVIDEPLGGAQRDRHTAMTRVGAALRTMLGELQGMDPPALRTARRQKYLNIGAKGLTG
jgi:acetyl-CoA carboxylase carboxyl transferase subunit alpha